MTAPKKFVTAQQALDLVADTLDPGYRAAAARRGTERDGRQRRRWYDQPLVALGTLLVGFLLVVAYVHTNRGAPEAQRVHDQLSDRVRGAQRNADDLAARVQRLDTELDEARAAALPASGALAQGLQRQQSAAGQVAVHGPGLRVTLTEPKAAPADRQTERAGSVPIASTHILTDRDVRAVVNELWHDGAEAIAVNGERLTPTSAIRFAGETVLVNFRPIDSPYDIVAIGPADRLATDFAQSAVASKYQTLKGAEGIGFSFADEDDVELPASPAAAPKFAKPQVAPR